MPGAPLGIFEKSSRPRCLWGGSFIPNGQWSVPTVCSSRAAIPRHRAS